MSQQINLFNPRLLPQRDIFSLPVVVTCAVLVLVLEFALFAKARHERTRLAGEEARISLEVTTLRQQVETVEKTLAERKPNVALANEASALRLVLVPREEALRTLADTDTAGNGFAEYLSGLARQAQPGVWLTEFAISRSDITLRGRLTDPSLLPGYIRRLNAEKAFQGRTFATLDMKGVNPTPTPTPPGGAQATPAPAGRPARDAQSVARPSPPPVPPYYVEFSLLGTPPLVTKPGGGG